MSRPGPDYIKICKKCGQEYHPNSTRQQCCNRPVKIPCAVCGKLMDGKCTIYSQKETCSKECNNELIKRRQIESAHKLTKICKWCGKTFIPNSYMEEYCSNQHYATCEVCGKQFEINPATYLPKTCSDECRYILASQNKDVEAMKANLKNTMLERYGVENAMEIPEARAKIKETMRERYGGAYTATAEYKQRVKETSQKKYGTDHYLQSEEVKNKRKSTVQNRFGVDNVFKSEKIKEKSKQTCLSKYGVEHASQSKLIIDKVKNSNLDRYGVEHAMMLPEYQAKARDTNFRKFGVAAPTQSHITNIENWYKFINNPREYIEQNYSERPRTRQLADDLGVDLSTIDVYLSKKDAADCVRRAKSLMEEEVVSYIKEINPKCKILTNDHKVLKGKELDIYLPEYNFAIECNPTVTHNSSFPDPWGTHVKPINYHKHKTDKCESQGIFLMHIFGYDWSQHKEIMKSMIANIIGCSKRIYARRCNIVIVPYDKARLFLQGNHRQGFASSSIYLGLEYNGELVSLMSFGHMRSTIGIDSSDLSNCWELVRFCNKLNTSVIGGASKLFKYFVDKYQPEEIRSFSDRAHTKGNLYSVLGFKALRQSGANYVWVNIIDDKAYHRINAQKHNIKKFLKDNTIDLSQSENQIMESHGYARVYDSGTITWQWKSN